MFKCKYNRKQRFNENQSDFEKASIKFNDVFTFQDYYLMK